MKRGGKKDSCKERGWTTFRSSCTIDMAIRGVVGSEGGEGRGGGSGGFEEDKET